MKPFSHDWETEDSVRSRGRCLFEDRLRSRRRTIRSISMARTVVRARSPLAFPRSSSRVRNPRSA